MAGMLKIFTCMGLMLCMLIGIVGATSLDVSNYVNLRGEGSIDRSILLQTDSGFNGQKYNEDIYTPSLGMEGSSFINYSEELTMILGNESLIEISGDGVIINAKSLTSIKNYDMGAMQSHKFVGNSVMEYEYMADSSITYQVLDGKIEGKGEIYNLIRCPLNKTYMLRDKTEFEGNFEFEIEMEISKIDYPASEFGTDWLGCP